jgi:hypothetical protein
MNMIRFSVQAQIVIDGTTGKEQLTITYKVRSKKIATMTYTTDEMGRYPDYVREFLWRALCDQMGRQNGIHFIDEQHPWQEELPF